MTQIARVLAVPAVGAYYYDDLAALQSRSIPVPERYLAEPVTPGFRRVREPAEAVSVGLALDDGRVAWGDCVAVEFSGQAGRDPAFRTAEGMTAIEGSVVPLLEGRRLACFRDLAAEVEAATETVEVERPLPRREPGAEISRRELLTAPARLLNRTERVTVERRLHTAVRYGVSQALLGAVGLARGLTPAEVICQEWELPLPVAAVPIHAQSGGRRYANADKMIARRVASLPHGLVDNMPEQLGPGGGELLRYARWLKGRIEQLGGSDYRPTIHLDVHGALGQILENNLGKVLGQLLALERAVQPYPLRVECPVLMASREAQIEALKTLREYVGFHELNLQIVADEWANTLDDVRAFVEAGAADMIQIKMPDLGGVQEAVEAVLACKAGGVGAFVGGSCAETDLSARASAHVALATGADLIMAKPGMGVDEGIAIVGNEMARTLAVIRAGRDEAGSVGSHPGSARSPDRGRTS
jgi:methylaspartate ammonia-lyase